MFRLTWLDLSDLTFETSGGGKKSSDDSGGPLGGIVDRFQPPGGSLGGGPGPMSEAQNVPSPLGFRIVFYDDFDIDF